MEFDYTQCEIFHGGDSNSDHCLVNANVKENLAASKQGSQKLDVETFNLRHLKDQEVR